MSDEQPIGPDEITPANRVDDDIIAWFTKDLSDAAAGIAERARELASDLHKVRHEALEEDRRDIYRMIALLCRAAHIVFADLDLPTIR